MVKTYKPRTHTTPNIGPPAILRTANLCAFFQPFSPQANFTLYQLHQQHACPGASWNQLKCWFHNRHPNLLVSHITKPRLWQRWQTHWPRAAYTLSTYGHSLHENWGKKVLHAQTK